jgi:hypothetical protein
MHLFVEVQIPAVEGDCGVDIVDDVTDADSGHAQSLAFLGFDRTVEPIRTTPPPYEARRIRYQLGLDRREAQMGISNKLRAL